MAIAECFESRKKTNNGEQGSMARQVGAMLVGAWQARDYKGGKMNYEWKKDHKRAVSPQAVGERIEQLCAGGVCHPSLLVDDARPERSLLHDFFDWDDAIAAEKHRIQQARQVISNIRIRPDSSEQQVPAFVHVRIAEQDGYVPTVTAVSDAEMREQVLDMALKQYSALNERYATLQELEPLRAAFAQVRVAEPVGGMAGEAGFCMARQDRAR